MRTSGQIQLREGVSRAIEPLKIDEFPQIRERSDPFTRARDLPHALRFVARDA